MAVASQQQTKRLKALLTELEGAGSDSGKTTTLKSLVQFTAAAPALAHEAVAPVLSCLPAASSDAVRLGVVDFLELRVLLDPGSLALVLPSLVAVLAPGVSVPVAVRTMHALRRVYRPVFEHHRDCPTEPNKFLWPEFSSLLTESCERLAGARVTPLDLKQACVALVQTMVTVLGDQQYTSPHPYLGPAALAEQTEATLALLTRLGSQMPTLGRSVGSGPGARRGAGVSVPLVVEDNTPKSALAATTAACKRMLRAGDALHQCGGEGIVRDWRRLVCQLACDPELDFVDRTVACSPAEALPEVGPPADEDASEAISAADVEAARKELVTAVVANIVHHKFAARQQLALQLLDTEVRVKPPSDSSLYSHVLSELLTGAHDLLPASDDAVSTLVMKAPAVLPTHMAMLKSYCLEPGRQRALVRLLVEILGKRPELGPQAVQFLLEFAWHTQDKLRKFTIATLIREESKLPSLRKDLLAFAESLLQSLSAPPAPSVAAGDALEVAVEDPDVAALAAGAGPVAVDAGRAGAGAGAGAGADAGVGAGAAAGAAADKSSSGASGSGAASGDEPSEEMQAIMHAPVDDTDCQRRLDLPLALCTREPALIRSFASAYAPCSDTVKQQVVGKVEKLVKHLAVTQGLVKFVHSLQGFPAAAVPFVAAVLRQAVDASSKLRITADVVAGVKTLYASDGGGEDVRLLVPVLAALPKPEVEAAILRIIALPLAERTASLRRLWNTPSVTSPVTPGAALVLVLTQDPTDDTAEALKGGTAALFGMHDLLPADAIQDVLRNVVATNPLPRMTMRALLLAWSTYPTQVMQGLLLGLMKHLVQHWFWTSPHQELVTGFVLLAKQLMPASIPVLVNLPPDVLGPIINKASEAVLKTRVAAWATEHATSLRPGVAEMLGVAPGASMGGGGAGAGGAGADSQAPAPEPSSGVHARAPEAASEVPAAKRSKS